MKAGAGVVSPSFKCEVRHKPNLSLKRTQTLAGLVHLARAR